MRLNSGKCKILAIGAPTTAAPALNDEPMESVASYKYLGVELTNSLDWDAQWKRVQQKTNSLPYLLKRLKRLGFKRDILISVYRSLGLSHINYSAPLLTSASNQAKTEMAQYQRRILRIINISAADAAKHHGIISIDDHIDNTCAKIMSRILNDKDHNVTRLVEKVYRTTSVARLKIRKDRT